MITIYYAVCSETAGKPLVHQVFRERKAADGFMHELRINTHADRVWLAEMGKEAESWLRHASPETSQAE